MYDLKDTNGKVYITKAGYVIPFLHDKFGHVEFCPFRNARGQTAAENSKIKRYGKDCGWQWEKNGQIQFDSKETADALEIIDECPKELIPKLPEEYRYKGGYPKFEKVNHGDYYLNKHGFVCSYPNDDKTHVFLLECGVVKEGYRILLEKVSATMKLKGGWYITQNGYAVEIEQTQLGFRGSINGVLHGWDKDGSPDGKNRTETKIIGECPKKLIPKLPSGYRWVGDHPRFVIPEKNQTILCDAGRALKVENAMLAKSFTKYGVAEGRRILIEAVPTVPAEPEKDLLISEEVMKEIQEWGLCVKTPSKASTENLPADYTIDFAKYARWDIFNSGFKKKEEEMKKETAIAASKAVGSFAWKTANYWLFEPATAWGKKAMSSVRHVVFAGLVFGSFCLWMNPQKTLDIAKSCLPKISISVEAPEIVR